MSRLDRPVQKSSNPASKFLSWKSNDKAFAYYDKDKQENVLVKLPLKMVFLEHYHTVKGWNDKTESGIYSNEVYAIGSEEVSVKAFKGGEIASGLYKDIKPKIQAAGGVYHRSVYVMLEDGSIANLSIKGSAVSSYSDFYKENNHLLDNQWFLVDKAIDGKKGAVKFSTPNFLIGEVLTRDEDAQVVKAAAILQDHINTYNGKEVVSDVVEEPIEEDIF
jgi:hypothetical protein